MPDKAELRERARKFFDVDMNNLEELAVAELAVDFHLSEAARAAEWKETSPPLEGEYEVTFDEDPPFVGLASFINGKWLYTNESEVRVLAYRELPEPFERAAEVNNK